MLDASDVENRIYLGDNYNGAGGDPENGRVAAEKTCAKIKGVMGGGTTLECS